MEERICTHKECPFAGSPQSIGQFSKDRTKPSGYHPHCRTCRSRNAQLRMESNPDARERASAATARYRTTERGRERTRAYYEEHKPIFRERDRQYAKRPEVRAKRAAKQASYRERNQHKECARTAVYNALRSGHLSIPERCDWCGQPANGERLEAHHWRGYDAVFWLDVKFVHATCHDACESVAPDEWS